MRGLLSRGGQLPNVREVVLPLRGEQPPIKLPYRHVEIPAKQRRLQGRHAMMPDLDFSGEGFACSAEIDWLAIKLKLASETQWKYLNEHAKLFIKKRPWATGPNGERRHTGDEFIIRIQTPQRKQLVAALDAIDKRWGLAGEPSLSSMEFSIDFYPDDGTEESRRMMVGVLQRHFLPPYNCMRMKEEHGRFAYGKGNTTIVSEEEINAPFIDSTTYFGRDGGDVMWRIMDKVSDERRSRTAAKTLKPEDRRARVEVVLSEGELRRLGLTKLSDLDSFDFTRLRKPYFRFALPTFAEGEGESGNTVQERFAAARWEIFAKAGVYGLRETDARQIDIKRAVNRVRQTGKIKTASGKPERFRASESLWFAGFLELHKRIVDSARNLSWNP